MNVALTSATPAATMTSLDKRRLLLGVDAFRCLSDAALRAAYAAIWLALESAFGRDEARAISQHCAERADALLLAAKGRNALAHTTSFANGAISELCAKAPARAQRLHANLLAAAS